MGTPRSKGSASASPSAPAAKASAATSPPASQAIDTARLKSALKVTALLVQEFGNVSLPFVLSHETELAQLEARQAARARVRKVLETGEDLAFTGIEGQRCVQA